MAYTPLSTKTMIPYSSISNIPILYTDIYCGMSLDKNRFRTHLIPLMGINVTGIWHKIHKLHCYSLS